MQTSERQCAICLAERPLDVTLLSHCRHLFCFACITEWTRIGGAICPLCKASFEVLVHSISSVLPPDYAHLQSSHVRNYDVAYVQRGAVDPHSDQTAGVKLLVFRRAEEVPERLSASFRRFVYRKALQASRISDSRFSAPASSSTKTGAVASSSAHDSSVDTARRVFGNPHLAAHNRFNAVRAQQGHPAAPGISSRPVMSHSSHASQARQQQMQQQESRVRGWLLRELRAVLGINNVDALAELVVTLLQQRNFSTTTEDLNALRAVLDSYLSEHLDHFLHELAVFTQCDGLSISQYDSRVRYPGLYTLVSAALRSVRDSAPALPSNSSSASMGHAIPAGHAQASPGGAHQRAGAMSGDDDEVEDEIVFLGSAQAGASAAAAARASGIGILPSTWALIDLLNDDLSDDPLAREVLHRVPNAVPSQAQRALQDVGGVVEHAVQQLMSHITHMTNRITAAVGMTAGSSSSSSFTSREEMDVTSQTDSSDHHQESVISGSATGGRTMAHIGHAGPFSVDDDDDDDHHSDDDDDGEEEEESADEHVGDGDDDSVTFVREQQAGVLEGSQDEGSASIDSESDRADSDVLMSPAPPRIVAPSWMNRSELIDLSDSADPGSVSYSEEKIGSKAEVIDDASDEEHPSDMHADSGSRSLSAGANKRQRSVMENVDVVVLDDDVSPTSNSADDPIELEVSAHSAGSVAPALTSPVLNSMAGDSMTVESAGLGDTLAVTVSDSSDEGALRAARRPRLQPPTDSASAAVGGGSVVDLTCT